MTNRVAVLLDSISGVTGFEDLDISVEEIAVANMPNLVMWPYVSPYGMFGANGGFYDRMSDDVVWKDTAGNGWAIVLIGPNNAPAYGAGSTVSILRTGTLPSLSAGFTIGEVIGGAALGTSANTSSAGSGFWLDRDSATFKPYFKLGTYTSDPASWAGPAMVDSNATSNVVLWRYEPGLGRVTVRINEYSQSWTDAGMVNVALHPQVQWGLVNKSGTLISRFGRHGMPILFNRALSDAEMVTLKTALQKFA